MTDLNLPRDLVKGDITRTASTPTEYWSLSFDGFRPVDGPAVASVEYDDLTPGQKAARTRALNKQREEQEEAVDTSSKAVDTDPTNQAGDANES